MSYKFLELFTETIDFKGTSMESIENEELNAVLSSYSISFWLYVPRFEKNKQVTVIHKGSSFSSNPLIALQENTLYIKLDLDRSRSESLFSSLALPAKKWIHIVFTFKEFDYSEASLYINGIKDSEISVSKSRDNEKIPTNHKIYIGKDPWSHGLIGKISEPVFYLSALDNETIMRLYEYGKANNNNKEAFATTKMFLSAQDRPSSGLLPISAVPKLLETTPRRRINPALSTLTIDQKLDKFFSSNQSTYSKVVQLVNYVDWLTVIYRILRISLPTFRDEEGGVENKLEVDRMLPPLYQIRLNFTKKELVELAKILKCHSVVVYDKAQTLKDNKSGDVIQFVDFFEGLRKWVDSFEMGELMLISRDEIDAIDRRNTLFARADEWYSSRSGNFEICLDFCSNCERHQTTTRHELNEYIQWYNEVYKELNDEFSGILVYGNKYGPPTIGVFAAYLEYLGTENTVDQYERLKLYKIKNDKPNAREIIDSIYLISYLLGDTNEICRRQADYKRQFGEKDRHPDSLTGIGVLSINNKLLLAKTPLSDLDADCEMFCRQWGCREKTYINSKNHKKACQFHPGRWEFGSIHGLWPENWTCCRGQWDSPGCTYGKHKGIPNRRVMKKCINRGELNPKTQKPDSVCGCAFPDPATCGKKYQVPTDCNYHTGHIEYQSKNSGIWTCCRVEFSPNFPDDSYCIQVEHRFAEWPDEEAKIYFITKGINSNSRLNFADSAKSSRFFNNDIQPYVNPYAAKREKEALENENRYCLNWACEKVYKECDNTDKACKCHTGYWDFGHSGILKGRETIVLWEPHWRCCGGKWEDVGCTMTRHSGPLVAKMEERKWKWPSEGFKRNFLKKISHLWQKKLEGEHLTRKEVSAKYDQFCAEISSKVLPANMLHRLTLILHLHILCVSEDLSFMFKYQDVISKQAENLLADKGGYIDKETFLEWWFAPLERIRPEMALS